MAAAWPLGGERMGEGLSLLPLLPLLLLLVLLLPLLLLLPLALQLPPPPPRLGL